MSRRPAGGVRRIVFWQPIESPHQRDFLEAVAVAFGGEVVLAAETRLPAERVAQGWPGVVHERVRVLNAADPAIFRDLVACDARDTLHVFSGFFSHRIVWSAFRRLASTSARRAMISEAPEMVFATGWVKRLRGRYLVQRFGDRFDFIMAMGTVGRRFMEDVGFPSERVVTFGYRLRVPDLPSPPAASESIGPVHLLAAGQLIHRKGFDVLLDACAMLPAEGWTCRIYGDGPLRETLLHRVRRLSLGRRVQLSPTIANEHLRREIATSDVCVVPSRHDGWGMLVNESLIAGTPVVCSDNCGAADLVSEDVVGQVVPAGDSSALAAVLRDCIAAGRIDAARRSLIHAVAVRHGVDEIVELFLSRLDGLP